MPVIYSPLSDSELDSICLSLVNQDLPYFSAFHEAFVLLYLTGCRVEEIFDINRWERLQGYEMMFLPQKDNYWRYVSLDSRCDNFIDAVVGKYKPFGGLSSGQLNSLFYNFSEYSNYKVGTKPVSLYLFRYNYIRQLFNDGLNINQIADKMGYTSTAVVGGYLTAEIEKGFFLDTDDFININGTWWAKSYLAVSTGDDNSIVLDSFGTGVLQGYYNKVGINSFLLSNPQFRLPLKDDFNSLNSYLSDNYGSSLRGCMIPDSAYWSIINSYMLNLFSLSFFGTGYYSLGVLTRFRSHSYFILGDASNAIPYCSISPSSVTPVFISYDVRNLLPVRLILNK